jgi:NAD(P)H-flavin reductase
VEESIYRPRVLRISEVASEAPGVYSLRAEPAGARVPSRAGWAPDAGAREAGAEPLPPFRPGQFALWSAFGEGECALALTGPPGETASASCTFRRVGRVTAGLSRLDVGDPVGFRGPFGKSFPLEELDGRNLLLVAGGIGLAALGSAVDYVLGRRDRFGTVTLLVGARTPEDLLYKGQFARWREADLSLLLTVDPGGESADWRERVGLVPQVLAQLRPSPANTIALVCGPPVMVRFTLLELERLDFPRRSVYTTLEARMKCGVGKCGHCGIGSFLVCQDGPVVSAEVLAGLADEW